MDDPNTKAPSIEESLKSLEEEGVIQPDDAQGGASGTSEGSTDERPDWLPEKFKSPEDMAKAYAELEKKQGGGKKDAPEEFNATATPEERAQAEEATQKAGLDLKAVSQEWFDNSGLTDETYTKLDKAGYPREMVDIYIEGLLSRNGAIVTEAHSVVGGEDAYSEMIEWAADNLPKNEQKAFDAAVNSGNKHRIITAIKALKADYEKAVKADASDEPEEMVTAKGRAKTNVYNTMDDYMEDLNDPRYDTNETFRTQVMQKLARSKIM